MRAPRIGPPRGPFASRVSATRHGVTGTNRSAPPGPCTVVVALACFEVVFVADIVAVFGYGAQPYEEVALVTCPAAKSPAARSPRLQANVWLPTAPVMAHVPGPLYTGLMLQLIPVPPRSEPST